MTGPAKEFKPQRSSAILRMVQHVDDAGFAAIVCTVRGNVYQYFENQLHVEHSLRGSPSQDIPSDLWNTKINYRRNIVHIPCIKNIIHIILKKTSLVVQWSVSLTTNHEAPRSIPGSTAVIFREGENSRGDHDMGRLVELRFKGPPGTTSSPISLLTSSGKRNCATWASQPLKSVTFLPCPGGRTTKSTRTCGGTGAGILKKKMHFQFRSIFTLCYYKVYVVLQVAVGVTHLQDIRIQRNSS